ncbi:complement C1q-like protein 3 [Saccostrea cucullata]|uniref:complement C1q-like protein 3 n=1 Tax=Saccostrea cuccullata TaxID=36930 RepID=UPI002ED5210A
MGYKNSVIFSILLLGILGISSGENIQRNVVSREEFEDLKKLVQFLNEKVEDQEQRLAEQDIEINTLKRDVQKKDEFIRKMSIISKEKSASKEEIDLRGHNIAKRSDSEISLPGNFKRKLHRIVPAPTESVVAFYAYMSANEINPGAHHTLIYDHEVTNIGNGYSKHSGTFTAPVGGVYVFTWNTFTVANSGQYMSIEITQNSQPVGATFVQGGGDYAGVTGTVVLSVQKNDVIYTRTHSTYAPHGSIRSDNLMRSTFSGWCLSCH